MEYALSHSKENVKEYAKKYGITEDVAKEAITSDYFDYFVKTVQIDEMVFDLNANIKKQVGYNGGYTYTIIIK